MFWSDWGDVPKIERASMNGDPTSRKVIVKEVISFSNAVMKYYEN
jgi:low density lipoprotein receptor-related protein 5/6